MTTKDVRVNEKHLLNAIEYLHGRGIEAGVFGGTNRQSSRKNPKNKKPKKGTPIALYGFIQHEGTRNGEIEPRRWLSGAVDRNHARWERMFEEGMERVLRGVQTTENLLTMIAVTEVVGEIQKMITELHVIDTGALRMSIQAKVRKGDPRH